MDSQFRLDPGVPKAREDAAGDPSIAGTTRSTIDRQGDELIGTAA